MATRLDKLGDRRIDRGTVGAGLVNESWRSIAQSDSVRYVIGAMQPIDPEYTKNTFGQGDRVRQQLKTRLKTTCDYEYQGSTTNDTHIRAASDIDLLVLTKKFWTLESPQVPESPYTGDPVQELLALREDAIAALKVAFPAAKVDAGGSKSIVVTGGSLTRKVDVVPSNWFDTNEYAKSRNKVYRGVQILDCQAHARLKNTPFLHNALVDRRDRETGGGLRKAARLLKSLKYDSDAVDLTSYDLVAIAYNIPTASLSVPRGQELALLAGCVDYVHALQIDTALRSAIAVPDGHRRVFDPGHATIAGLSQLAAEMEKLVADVLAENKRSFARLAEARVAY